MSPAGSLPELPCQPLVWNDRLGSEGLYPAGLIPGPGEPDGTCSVSDALKPSTSSTALSSVNSTTGPAPKLRGPASGESLSVKTFLSKVLAYMRRVLSAVNGSGPASRH